MNQEEELLTSTDGGTAAVGSTDNDETIPPEKEEFAFGYILEVLTQGLYPNVLDVIREYVQNAYDSVVKHRKTYKGEGYKIKINILGDSVLIADNGLGMSATKIRDYRKVGYSDKSSRESAGFRGIGKLSGISVAENLVVSSKVQGETKGSTIKFSARRMLEEILALKRAGQNKPLNDLISDNTEFGSFTDDDTGAHYTVVELQRIRPEHAVLLDSHEIASYVRSVCPVPFDKAFEYHEQIDRMLLANVPDYLYFPHLVNDQPIYKPYPSNIGPPEFYTVESMDGLDTLAFGWACQNKEDKQLPETGHRGLSFRIKNISIGDYRLARTLLWKQSGHLAYWFFGEVHVIDQEVVPSSERSSFEDNAARQQLIDRCQVDMIAPLERTARQRSGLANADKKRQGLQKLVEDTNVRLKQQVIARENVVYEAAKLVTAADQVKKNKRQFKGKIAQEVDVLLQQAEELIANLEVGRQSEGHPEGTFDIKEQVLLLEEEERFYDLVVGWLNDVFAGETARFAEAIDSLHEMMLQEFPHK